MILEILQAWRGKKPESKMLFTTLLGKKINDRYLRAMVKRRAKKAGVTKDVHPHTLRHTFATDLYRDTKNIKLVQKALGHAALSSTMIYTHIHDEALAYNITSSQRLLLQVDVRLFANPEPVMAWRRVLSYVQQNMLKLRFLCASAPSQSVGVRPISGGRGTS